MASVFSLSMAITFSSGKDVISKRFHYINIFLRKHSLSEKMKCVISGVGSLTVWPCAAAK